MAGRPKKPLSLAEFGFSEEMVEQIDDLREGYAGAPAHRVIAEALQHFFNGKGIDAEPEVKRRYLAAREKRTAAKRAPNS